MLWEHEDPQLTQVGKVQIGSPRGLNYRSKSPHTAHANTIHWNLKAYFLSPERHIGALVA